MLAGSLQGVISQRLIPTVDGKGRVAACEILTMTGRVRDMIVDAVRPGSSARRSGTAPTTGCRPSTRRCCTSTSEGKISMDDALKAATHPHDFKLLVASDGQRASSVDQIFRSEHKSVSGPPPGGERRRETDAHKPQPQRRGQRTAIRPVRRSARSLRLLDARQAALGGRRTLTSLRKALLPSGARRVPEAARLGICAPPTARCRRTRHVPYAARPRSCVASGRSS